MQQIVIDTDRRETGEIKRHEAIRTTRLFDEVNFKQFVFSWNTCRPTSTQLQTDVSVDSAEFTIEESVYQHNWRLLYEVKRSKQTKINGLIVEPLIIYNCLSLWLESFNRPNPVDQMFVTLAVEKDIEGYRSICELSQQSEPIDLCRTGKKFEIKIPIALIGHNSKPTFVFKINIISKDSNNFTVCNQLSVDFEKLYIDQHSTDITFIFNDNKEIKAHKLILMARSPVFRAMFQSEMLEGKENRAKIEDMESEIFEKLLHYIYTGKKSVASSEHLADIIVAADKYSLNELKDYCEKEMTKYLSIENAAENLIISYLLNLDFLKIKTIEFMLSKKQDILKTDGYKNLLENYSQLIVKLFEKSSCL